MRDRVAALIPRPPATRGGYANKLTPPFEHVGLPSSCIDAPRRYLRSQLIPNSKHKKRWPSVPISKYVLIFLATLFKVANPARGQLNRENNIPLSPCVPEHLVSRDGFSRPVPRQPAHLHTQAESVAYLRDSSRVPRRRPFYETAIRHRVSSEFIGSRNCVPMVFTAESPPAQGQ